MKKCWKCNTYSDGYLCNECKLCFGCCDCEYEDEDDEELENEDIEAEERYWNEYYSNFSLPIIIKKI